MTPTQKYLESLGACKEAREWVGERSLQEAWNTCARLDWFRWLLRAPIVAEYNTKLALTYAEYNTKLAPTYAEYRAKRAPIDAEYNTKLAPIDASASCDEVRANFACPEVLQ